MILYLPPNVNMPRNLKYLKQGWCPVDEVSRNFYTYQK